MGSPNGRPKGSTKRPPLTDEEIQVLREAVGYTPEKQAQWDREAQELSKARAAERRKRRSYIAASVKNSGTEK